MSDSELFQRPQKEAKIYDLGHFQFWDDIASRPNYRASVVFGERNGAPRVTFFPNTESGPKIVPIGMDPITFLRFLDTFEEIVKGASGKRAFIDNYAPKDPNATSRTTSRDDMELKNQLFYGKDENGICWVGAKYGDQNVRIRLLPSLWHQFHEVESGEPVKEADASRAQALQIIASLRRVLAPYMGRMRDPTAANSKQGRAANDAAKSALSGPSSSIDDGEFSF